MKASRTSSRGRIAGDRQARRQHGRHVLHGMHGEVDLAGQQRLLDLLGEKALAAGLRQRPVLDAVAGRRDDAHLELVAGRAPCAASSRSLHLARLRQRQRRAARADADFATGLQLRAISPDARRCRTAGSPFMPLQDAAPARTNAQPPMARYARRRQRARRSCSASRRAATRPRPPSSRAPPTAAAASSSNVVRAQWEEHRRYGGVVPEIAARAHVECLDEIIAQAMREAGIGFADLDAVAVTAGPGLIGGLLVGRDDGQGHRAGARPAAGRGQSSGGARADGRPDRRACCRPTCCCWSPAATRQLLIVHDVGRYRRLGTTIDDALGEAFDKTAKLLGLGFPGGPAVERAAAQGTRRPLRAAAADAGTRGAAFLLRRLEDRRAPSGAGAGAVARAGCRRPVRRVRGGRRRQRRRPRAARHGDGRRSGWRRTPSAIWSSPAASPPTSACARRWPRSRRRAGYRRARAAAGAVHGQCRHGRLGRRRTAGARADRRPRLRSPRALAARSAAVPALGAGKQGAKA